MSRAADLFDQLTQGGVTRVQEMIANSEAEELFLDFKRSADNGSGVRLNNHDRANLAKSISGFGNSEGGVVVWGCPSSDDLRHIAGFRKGGFGSSVIEIMRHAVDAASDGLRWSGA